MVIKTKPIPSEGDCILNDINQFMLLNKQTKIEKMWSDSQKLAFTDLLKKYPNGGSLSEFLTCLQASIQVNSNSIFV